ncbi:MAG: cation-translocating P-type ATPase [Nanoarchaeota archaeon]|nr:cation-translocating P-type ATPase [Nanoarchaeota archaeon]
MEKEEWHSKDVKYVFDKLGASEKGFSSDEALKRLKEYGPNIITKEKKVSIFGVFLRQFKNFIIYVLLFAAVISFVIGDVTEFAVISIIVAVIILISFFEEYKASKEMEALKKLTPRKAKVLRDSRIMEIVASDVVPGDILHLDRGDFLPADARVISCNNLRVDESTLTGESVPVVKKECTLQKAVMAEQCNMLFAGTIITNGNCVAVVVATGKNTELGKISKMIGDVKEETTPLQKRLDKLSKQLSLGTFVICIFVVLLGVWRGQPLHEMMLLAVAVAVSGIPESLPTVVAVTLALGVKKMARRNAIIKRLPAVETLGTCTAICSDKTGTLTQNRMVIESIFTLDTEVQVTGEGFSPEGLFMFEGKKIDPTKHKTLSKAIEVGVFCNNSELKKVEEEWDIEGEPTEGAFVVMAKKAGLIKADMHLRSPRVKEHPFDPVRKCMTTVHLVNKKPIVYSKGAPELLLKKAKHYYSNGRITKLNKHVIEKILEKNHEFAKKGMRVLGLAFKEHNNKQYELKHVESELVFVGLVAMRDPPEPNAKESVRLCKEAGTKVVMITGDNRTTAEAIAKDLGIYSENDLIIEGPELDKMDDASFSHIVNKVTVYSRATPKHKLRIVEALQKQGHIVAMTGDGVNDAPALKKADIGVAMGKRGTDVAKEAAEMVIKDDNFSTIVNAIQEGRTIYANMRKFIYYLLAGNISEVSLIFIAILLGMSPPLTAIMILFLNLVTSDLPALGLCVEKPPKDLMKQRPRNPKEGILSDYLLLKIAQVIPFIVLGTIALFMWEIVIKHGSLEKAQTMAFATIVFFELFHIFNAKSWDESAISFKSLNNIYLTLGILFSSLLTIAVIYIPFAQNIFHTVSLSFSEWVTIGIMTSAILFFVEIQKTAINSEIRERERMEIHPTRG